MILDIDKSNARYERKFRIEQFDKKEIETIIKSNHYFFKEVFYERIVNNIYFDSEELSHYHNNVEGNKQRLKVRIRWYGELNKIVKEPRLELKIKDGLLGSKLSFPLKPFKFKDGKSIAPLLKKVFADSILPAWLKDYLKRMNPSLLNNYCRRYFVSFDKKCRITLDYNLKFYPFSFGNLFLKNFGKDDAVIVELKYEKEYDDSASFISNHFPFRLTKNSKYVGGVDILSGF